MLQDHLVVVVLIGAEAESLTIAGIPDSAGVDDHESGFGAGRLAFRVAVSAGNRFRPWLAVAEAR